MATTVIYPGLTGAQSDFVIPFEYLSAAHVHVTLEGAPVPFTFSSQYLVRVTTPPVGTLKIARVTPSAQTINDYTDGSILAGNDLDNSFYQNLFINQENTDRITIGEGRTDLLESAVSTLQTDIQPVYGIKSAAYSEATEFATALQGSKADTALQPGALLTPITPLGFNLSVGQDEILIPNGYAPNSIFSVILNGSTLDPLTDWVATDGTRITLTEPISAENVFAGHTTARVNVYLADIYAEIADTINGGGF